MCLLALSYMADELVPPDEYLIMLYRGVLRDWWDMDAVSEFLSQHYAALARGDRQRLPDNRLSNISREFFQEGEQYAVQLLGALYEAWRTSYQPPPPSLYGPHLAGQQPDPVVPRTLTRAQQATVVDQACELLSQRELAWLEERRPGTVFPPQLYQVVLSDFNRAVLSSYLTKEIGPWAAKELLATHHRNDSWRDELGV